MGICSTVDRFERHVWHHGFQRLALNKDPQRYHFLMFSNAYCSLSPNLGMAVETIVRSARPTSHPQLTTEIPASSCLQHTCIYLSKTRCVPFYFHLETLTQPPSSVGPVLCTLEFRGVTAEEACQEFFCAELPRTWRRFVSTAEASNLWGNLPAVPHDRCSLSWDDKSQCDMTAGGSTPARHPQGKCRCQPSMPTPPVRTQRMAWHAERNERS